MVIRSADSLMVCTICWYSQKCTDLLSISFLFYPLINCFFNYILLITENVVSIEDIRKIKNTVTSLTRVNHWFVVVQSLSCVSPFATPRAEAWLEACLSFPISWSLLRLMSIESVVPSNHLILCRPLLLMPSIFPSITVFSIELALRIRWPKYWSFSFSHQSSQWIFRVDFL